MSEKQKSFAIIKEIPGPLGITETLMIDTHSEVLEFDSFEEAEQIAKIMEANSNNGYKYRVRQVGTR